MLRRAMYADRDKCSKRGVFILATMGSARIAATGRRSYVQTHTSRHLRHCAHWRTLIHGSNATIGCAYLGGSGQRIPACLVRFISRKSIASKLPSNVHLDHRTLPSGSTSSDAAANDDVRASSATSTTTHIAASRSEQMSGIHGLYGNRAETAMRGMLGPQGVTEGVESKAVPILGRATVDGTQYTVERSTVFECWSHKCAEPVGWHLSRLGCTTCKMTSDVAEAVEALQLQVIKGCNVFEMDGASSEVHQGVSRALQEALQAFELERSGFVMMVRCGLITQPPFQDEITQVVTSNTAPTRNRIVPIFERFKASSIPSMQLKTGFRICELSDDQLGRLGLRRVSPNSAAGLSPDWLEAFFTNVAYNTKLECIDVVLLEGIHTLFDGRPGEHIDEDIVQLFAFLEKQVKLGLLQYYGISSPYLAPPVQRNYPPLPPDAMVPDWVRHPPPEPATLNLYHLYRLAERAGGIRHHFRFVQYPFNLTAHQAFSTSLPYDVNHTLLTLCRALSITTLGCSPLEATNLMRQPERYHKFPMEHDLKSSRMNFAALCERAVLKEMEVKEIYNKSSASLPPVEHLFVASLYVSVQLHFRNFWQFDQWVTHYVLPRFRRAVMQFKEAASSELKDWCKQYEQLIGDLVRLRRRLFDHKHGKKAAEISMIIDHISPSLAACPIISQKAINFATYGCDCLMCGFHVSRYFHEATELNPARNGELTVPDEELVALCHSPQVSFANASPPNPYMLEPIAASGRMSMQKSRLVQSSLVIDMSDPKFPDIPDELADSADAQAHHQTTEGNNITTPETNTT